MPATWQLCPGDGHQQRYLPDRQAVLRYMLAIGPKAASKQFEVVRNRTHPKREAAPFCEERHERAGAAEPPHDHSPDAGRTMAQLHEYAQAPAGRGAPVPDRCATQRRLHTQN